MRMRETYALQIDGTYFLKKDDSSRKLQDVLEIWGWLEGNSL